jgi:hypothetical protein
VSLLSISEAARTVGRSRGTIHRYLKKGNLSSTSDDTGNIKIDTSELLRVFGELKTNGTAHTAPPSVPFEQQGTAYIEILKEQLKTAQEREKAALERENKLINMLEQEQLTRRELEQKILALPEGRAKKPGLFARLFNRI